MRICVIGTGYVGLVTGTVFSDLGNEVVCVDMDERKVAMLRRCEMPIYEPGLEEMVRHNSQDGRLSFTTDLPASVRQSEIIFICVGTPTTATGEPDMSFVRAAAAEIGRCMNGYKVVVNKSTVPVGTGEMVREIIERHQEEPILFDVVSNPEFLREGSAIKDTLEPDRIVIGAPSQAVAMKVLELYAPLERPVLLTDVASAEMIKYASNAFLATKISFANAIANLCEEVGADVLQVVKGMGADSRISPAFLSAGLGYGGSCFPKDTAALVATAEKNGCDFGILKEVMRVNKEQPLRFVSRARAAVGGDLAGKTIGLLGLAFKPNTDDMRDAKSLDVIQQLLAEGAAVKVYDPIVKHDAAPILASTDYCESAYEAAEGVDALLIITEWNEFKQLDMERVHRLMRSPVILDGRNIYDPARLRRIGFDYYGIGRQAVTGSVRDARLNGQTPAAPHAVVRAAEPVLA